MADRTVRMANPTHRFETTAGPPADPDLAWSHQFSSTVRTVAVWDETVYVGTDDGTIAAVTAAEGCLAWRVETGEPITDSPAVVDGILYASGRGGTVYALDGSTGTVEWQYDTGSPVVAAPSVVEGTVYVGCLDQVVYALDAVTGTVEWRHHIEGRRPDGESSSPLYSPAVVDGTVYVSSEESTVYALDAGDGTVQWDASIEAPPSTPPTVAGGTVYVATLAEYVYALDAASGTRHWYQECGLVDSPAVVGDTLYVGGAYALDAATGDVVFGPSEPGMRSAVTVVDGTIYGVGTQHTLYGLDASTGAVEWEIDPVGNLFTTDAVVVDGTLYVGVHDETVQAYGTSTSRDADDQPAA